ncbi:MAG: hypothetical protein A2Z16_10290 [Chloroflexi bacterium RBG_16_54_18]|nr:MAG: hypothetical protein A2Z16_10290 [Chloroflexi bacterium RBG_16_54_18]OGO63966.1 MAG: hypothetical protein A2Z45_10770 [Chloroflexi bacterium RBG_19FT_COMBO_55_16]
MNYDILRDKWDQVQGELMKWWERLNDDDLQRIDGSSDELARLLQERYGYSQQEALFQIDEFLEKTEAKLHLLQQQR